MQERDYSRYTVGEVVDHVMGQLQIELDQTDTAERRNMARRNIDEILNETSTWSVSKNAELVTTWSRLNRTVARNRNRVTPLFSDGRKLSDVGQVSEVDLAFPRSEAARWLKSGQPIGAGKIGDLEDMSIITSGVPVSPRETMGVGYDPVAGFLTGQSDDLVDPLYAGLDIEEAAKNRLGITEATLNSIADPTDAYLRRRASIMQGDIKRDEENRQYVETDFGSVYIPDLTVGKRFRTTLANGEEIDINVTESMVDGFMASRGDTFFSDTAVGGLYDTARRAFHFITGDDGSKEPLEVITPYGKRKVPVVTGNPAIDSELYARPEFQRAVEMNAPERGFLMETLRAGYSGVEFAGLMKYTGKAGAAIMPKIAPVTSWVGSKLPANKMSNFAKMTAQSFGRVATEGGAGVGTTGAARAHLAPGLRMDAMQLVEEAYYGFFVDAVNGRWTPAETLAEATYEWGGEYFLGGVSRGLRRVGSSFMSSNVAQKIIKQAPKEVGDVAAFEAGLKSLNEARSRGVTQLAEAAQRGMFGAVGREMKSEFYGQVWDAAFTGYTFGAWGVAQQHAAIDGKDWDAMSLGDKASYFMSGLADASSFAQGLGMVATQGAYSAATFRSDARALVPFVNGEQAVANLAQRMGGPELQKQVDSMTEFMMFLMPNKAGEVDPNVITLIDGVWNFEATPEEKAARLQSLAERVRGLAPMEEAELAAGDIDATFDRASIDQLTKLMNRKSGPETLSAALSRLDDKLLASQRSRVRTAINEISRELAASTDEAANAQRVEMIAHLRTIGDMVNDEMERRLAGETRAGSSVEEVEVVDEDGNAFQGPFIPEPDPLTLPDASTANDADVDMWFEGKDQPDRIETNEGGEKIKVWTVRAPNWRNAGRSAFKPIQIYQQREGSNVYLTFDLPGKAREKLAQPLFTNDEAGLKQAKRLALVAAGLMNADDRTRASVGRKPLTEAGRILMGLDPKTEAGRLMQAVLDDPEMQTPENVLRLQVFDRGNPAEGVKPGTVTALVNALQADEAGREAVKRAYAQAIYSNVIMSRRTVQERGDFTEETEQLMARADEQFMRKLEREMKRMDKQLEKLADQEARDKELLKKLQDKNAKAAEVSAAKAALEKVRTERAALKEKQKLEKAKMDAARAQLKAARAEARRLRAEVARAKQAAGTKPETTVGTKPEPTAAAAPSIEDLRLKRNEIAKRRGDALKKVESAKAAKDSAAQEAAEKEYAAVDAELKSAVEQLNKARGVSDAAPQGKQSEGGVKQRPRVDAVRSPAKPSRGDRPVESGEEKKARVAKARKQADALENKAEAELEKAAKKRESAAAARAAKKAARGGPAATQAGDVDQTNAATVNKLGKALRQIAKDADKEAAESNDTRMPSAAEFADAMERIKESLSKTLGMSEIERDKQLEVLGLSAQFMSVKALNRLVKAADAARKKSEKVVKPAPPAQNVGETTSRKRHRQARGERLKNLASEAVQQGLDQIGQILQRVEQGPNPENLVADVRSFSDALKSSVDLANQINLKDLANSLNVAYETANTVATAVETSGAVTEENAPLFDQFTAAFVDAYEMHGRLIQQRSQNLEAAQTQLDPESKVLAPGTSPLAELAAVTLGSDLFYEAGSDMSIVGTPENPGRLMTLVSLALALEVEAAANPAAQAKRTSLMAGVVIGGGLPSHRRKGARKEGNKLIGQMLGFTLDEVETVRASLENAGAEKDGLIIERLSQIVSDTGKRLFSDEAIQKNIAVFRVAMIAPASTISTKGRSAVVEGKKSIDMMQRWWQVAGRAQTLAVAREALTQAGKSDQLASLDAMIDALWNKRIDAIRKLVLKKVQVTPIVARVANVILESYAGVRNRNIDQVEILLGGDRISLREASRRVVGMMRDESIDSIDLAQDIQPGTSGGADGEIETLGRRAEGEDIGEEESILELKPEGLTDDEAEQKDIARLAGSLKAGAAQTERERVAAEIRSVWNNISSREAGANESINKLIDEIISGASPSADDPVAVAMHAAVHHYNLAQRSIEAIDRMIAILSPDPAHPVMLSLNDPARLSATMRDIYDMFIEQPGKPGEPPTLTPNPESQRANTIIRTIAELEKARRATEGETAGNGTPEDVGIAFAMELSKQARLCAAESQAAAKSMVAAHMAGSGKDPKVISQIQERISIGFETLDAIAHDRMDPSSAQAMIDRAKAVGIDPYERSDKGEPNEYMPLIATKVGDRVELRVGKAFMTNFMRSTYIAFADLMSRESGAAGTPPMPMGARQRGEGKAILGQTLMYSGVPAPSSAAETKEAVKKTVRVFAGIVNFATMWGDRMFKMNRYKLTDAKATEPALISPKRMLESMSRSDRFWASPIGKSMTGMASWALGVYQKHWIGYRGVRGVGTKRVSEANEALIGTMNNSAYAAQEFMLRGKALMEEARGWGLHESEYRLMGDMLASGAAVRFRSPEEFEKATGRKGTGRLYEHMVAWNELLMDMGREMVDLGLISNESFEMMKDQYLPRRMLNISVGESGANYYVTESEVGTSTTPMAASERRRGPAESSAMAVQAFDIRYTLPVTVAKVAKRLEMFRVLSQLKKVGTVISKEEYDSLSPIEKAQFTKVADKGLSRTLDGKIEAKLTDEEAEDLRDGKLPPEDARRILEERRNTTLEAAMMQTAIEQERSARKAEDNMTPKMEELLSGLETGYITWHGLREVSFMLERTETTGRSVSDNVSAISDMVQQMTLEWRQLRTVQNPKHWVLQFGTNLITNSATGKVPIGDMITSVLNGEGVYADAAHEMTEWWNLRAAGMKEEDMPEGPRRFGAFVREMGGATLAQMINDPVRPQDTVMSMFYGADGKPLFAGASTEAMEIFAGLTAAVSRSGRGHANMQTKIKQLSMSPNPAARAEAIRAQLAIYNLHELFWKYAATIEGMNRGLSFNAAVRWGAEGTGDFSDRNTTLMRMTTQFTSGASQLREKAYQKLGAKKGKLNKRLLGRQLLTMGVASPFWMYRAAMIPTLARASFTMKGASAMAFMTLLIRGIGAAFGGDDEDLREAAAGTDILGGVNPNDAAVDIFKRRYADATLPGFGGGGYDNGLKTTVSDLVDYWRGFGNNVMHVGTIGLVGEHDFRGEMLTTARGPTVGGSSTMINMADFAPSIALVNDMSAGDMPFVGTMFSGERANAPDTRNGFGLLSHAATASVVNMIKAIYGESGKTRWQEMAEIAAEVTAQASSPLGGSSMLPPTFSKEYQTMYSEIAWDGRSIGEWAAGLPTPRQKSTFGEMVSMVGTRTALPMTRVSSASRLPQLEGATSQGSRLLKSLGVEPFTTSPSGDLNAEAAIRDREIRTAVLNLIGRAYRESLDNPTVPHAARINSMINLGLDLRSLGYDSATGVEIIDVSDAPQTEIGRWLYSKAKDPAERRRWVRDANDAIRSRLDGLNTMLSSSDGLVYRRDVDPALHDRMVRAMWRSSDSPLLMMRFLHQQLKEDDGSRTPLLSRIWVKSGLHRLLRDGKLTAKADVDAWEDAMKVVNSTTSGSLDDFDSNSPVVTPQEYREVYGPAVYDVAPMSVVTGRPMKSQASIKAKTPNPFPNLFR